MSDVIEILKRAGEIEIAGVRISNIFLFLIILLISLIIAKIARINVRRIFKERLPAETLLTLEKVTYYVIILIGLIVALPQIGLSISGLVLAGGIFAIIIGFATQTVVSNFISGLFLLVEKPIKVGDGVKIGDAEGVVKDIKILSTTIRTWDGLYVRIPNEKVFTSDIKNYSAHAARRFEYTVGIRYSDDADKAVEIIKKLLEEHPMVLKEPAPQIFVNELADSSVDLLIKIWAPSGEWYSVKTELLWKIKVALEKEGIEVPFPQRVIWMGRNKD